MSISQTKCSWLLLNLSRKSQAAYHLPLLSILPNHRATSRMLWVSNEEKMRVQLTILIVDMFCSVLFCSLAVFDPRVGHTMDVLSPFISVLLCSDWLFHGESCPCIDVVRPRRAWSSSPACTWHCSLHYLFLQTLVTLSGNSPSPPTDNIWAMVIVWRVRGEIIWPALCCCAHHMHTYIMSSLYTVDWIGHWSCLA